MYKSTLIISFLLCSSLLFSQNRLSYSEYGGGVSTMNYSGDIATTYSVRALIRETRPAFGIFALRHFNDWFAMGANLKYGWFYASDLNHSNPNREFNVTTTTTQLNAVVEANLVRYGKYHYDRKVGFYVQTGGGLLSYNPQIIMGKLVPDNVILQTNSYSTTSFFFTFGMKFRTAYKGSMRVELCFTQTGKDNLDGFEYRNTLSNSDFIGGIGIYYSFLSY